MTLSVFSDEHYMKEALKEAALAFDADEVPVGAVIVHNNRVIARAHNLSERLNDATAHAEMQAITAASEFMGAKFLEECTLYVTLEPCLMCAGACFWSRIGRIVFGARDEKRGFGLMKGHVLHPDTIVESGILQKECGELITGFFKQKRLSDV